MLSAVANFVDGCEHGESNRHVKIRLEVVDVKFGQISVVLVYALT